MIALQDPAPSASSAPGRSCPLHYRYRPEAIAIDIDLPRWRGRFQALWPEGSDAHVSYFDRIVRGPDYAATDALRPLE